MTSSLANVSPSPKFDVSTPNAVHRVVDPGREFMGAVTKEMETFTVGAQRFNGTRQSSKDSTAPLLNACSGTSKLSKLLLPEGQRSSEWLVRLAAVVSALNGEVTRLI